MSQPTDFTDICKTCGKLVRWHKHRPDALNPIGLWHHEEEGLDDEHPPYPKANSERYEREVWS